MEKIAVYVRHCYLSLYMGGFWSAGWIFIPTSRPEVIHTEWQIQISHRYSNFLLMMGTWMPETRTEEK